MYRAIYTLLFLSLTVCGTLHAQPAALDKAFGGGDGEINFSELGLQPDQAFRRKLSYGADRLYVFELEVASGNARVTVLDAAGTPRQDVNNGNAISVPRPSDFFLGAELVIRQDGGFFIVGTRRNATDLFVYAYRPDGTVDNAFASNGRLVLDLNNRGGVVVTNFSPSMTGFGRADGGLAILLGSVRNMEGSFDYWLNLGADGTLDATAAGAGLLKLPFGYSFGGITRGVIREADGTLVRVIAQNDSVTVERRLPGGVLDVTFGQFGRLGLQARRAASDLRGTLVAAGDGGYYLAILPKDVDTYNADTTYLPILRITPQGQVDATWGKQGLVHFLGFGTSPNPVSAFVRDGGGVYLLTEDNFSLALYALGQDGRLDTNFGAAGRIVVGSYVNQQSVNLLAHAPQLGRFYGIQRQILPTAVAGEKIKAFHGPNFGDAGRYSGSVDLSYGGPMIPGLSISAGNGRLFTGAVIGQRIEADGSRRTVYTEGDALQPRAGRMSVVDMDAEGLPRAGTTNGVRYTYDLQEITVVDAILADQDVIVAGSTRTDGLLQRFGPDGLPKAGYGQSGMVMLAQLAFLDRAYLQADGSVLVVGNVKGTNQWGVVRVDASGQIDAAFGTSGIYTLPGESIEGHAAAVSGGIYLVSLINQANDALLKVVQLLPSGQLVGSFGESGTATYRFAGTRWQRDLGRASLHATSDQRGGLLVNSVIDGNSTSLPGGSSAFLLSIDGAGNVRQDFNGGVPLPFPFVTRSSVAKTIAQFLVQADGKVLLSQRTTNNENWYVIRLLTDGRLDPDFGPHGLGWTTDLSYQLNSALVNQERETFDGGRLSQTPQGQLILAGSLGGGAPAAIRLFNDSAPVVGLREVLPEGHDPQMSIRYDAGGSRKLLLGEPLLGLHQVSLYTSAGQLVWQNRGWTPQLASSLDLPMPGVGGVYLVALRQPDGSLRTLPVIF